jgi:hypothetical protein
MAVAMTALAVAIGGTAAAEPIAHVAKAISGKKIKKRSIPGNRIKANSLGGTEIAEAKLGKVPTAGSADSAVNAGHATNADSATNAGDAAKLGGLAPSAFVQGGGSHVQIRKTIPQNTAEAKLFSIQDAGTISFGCVPGFTKVRFKNDTGQQQDVAITFISPNAPHANVDFSAQYGPGGESGFTLGALHWMIHAGSGNGQATLDLSSSFDGNECVIDVQGLSTLALT